MVRNLSTAKYEADLIAGCMKNDTLAQKRVYEWLSPRMFALCYRYVGEREAAMDVLQDGFITLFEKIGSYKGEGSFEGWARRIFITAALMHLRKKDALKHTEQIDDYSGEMMYDSHVMESMDAQVLLKVIAQMPAGFRTVFNMYAIEGYSHQEIAQELGITEGGARSQLSRAKLWLKEKIKEY
ncbi:MAG: sigma-70 family RNA polymerase sigma factor [Bacteroidales bacterium]|nr:sigma-70 family RNA polymerase sigma factor [Bacteroidales bacterium]